MPCERYEELIYQHSEGLLDAEDAQRVESHLAQCAACRELTAQLNALSDALRALPRAPVPGKFASGVSKRVAASRPTWQAEASWWEWLPLPGPGRRVAAFALAAAAVVVIVAGSAIMTKLMGQPMRGGAIFNIAESPRQAVDALPIAMRRAGGFVQRVSREYVPIGRRSPGYFIASLLLVANLLLYATRPNLGRATAQATGRYRLPRRR